MNAIEMAAKAAFEKMLSGLSDRIPELLANLPPEIAGTIGQMGQIALSLKAQLDRIENQQRLIMRHLNIPDDTSANANGADNGQQQLFAARPDGRG